MSHLLVDSAVFFLLDFRRGKSSAGTGTETEMVCISLRSYSQLNITSVVLLPLTTKVK